MKSFLESSSNNEIISVDREINSLNNDELSNLYNAYKENPNKELLEDLYLLLDDIIEDGKKLNIIFAQLKKF